jgi:AmpD protein
MRAMAEPSESGLPGIVELPWADGWYPSARAIVSPNQGPRPAGAQVTLLVLHSISLPPGHYGGDAIERLFTNRLDDDGDPRFADLRGLRVSSHFVIRRDGELQQFVSCDARAWHAGRSSWRGREGCNDYSIGIELEGLEGELFEPGQYQVLAGLMRELARRYPVESVAGHQHIAPGRKGDPGAGFDWAGLRGRLNWPAERWPEGLPGTSS